MGRNLDRNHSVLQFEKYYRGCIWGLIPLQFQSFKKLMPHVKQKHARNSKAGLKTEANEPDEGQEFEFGRSDSGFTAMDNSKENIPIHTSNENSRKKVTAPQQARLRRTYSIHHLEPPSNYLNDSNVDLKHPDVIHKLSDGLGETDNTVSHPRTCTNVGLLDDEQVVCNSKNFGEQDLRDQAAVDAEQQFSGLSKLSSETYEDFFYAFQIDKKLLMKSSQNSDIDDFASRPGKLNSHRRVTLRRSDSFPVANKPCFGYGNLTPSKLESKLTEVWPSSPSSSTFSVSFHSSENILMRSRSCTLPVNVFGELAAEKGTHYETDQRAHDHASNVRKYKLSRIRRASSLTESLERYTQLFETSFRRDAKLNISKSLRLSNKDEVGFNQSDSIFLRKVQSMREALQIEWDPDSIEFSKVPNKSEIFSTVSEQSESEVNKDEYCAGLERQHSFSYSSEPRLSAEQHIKFDSEPYSASLPLSDSEDILTAISNQDDFLVDSVLGTEDKVTFSYEQSARNILESIVSGNSLFMSTELNNKLYEELHSDLVNEALYEVYSIFDAYWPTPLCSSSSCYMHLLPNTEHLVGRKVQSRIQKLQSLSLKTDNSMDNIVSFDLGQGNDWMNLQADAESLGLALDEIIFDELIEELVYV